MTLNELKQLSDDELTELLATKVMGWKYDSEDEIYFRYPDDNKPLLLTEFLPLKDMNHAMMIVEKFAAYQIDKNFDGVHFCLLWNDDKHKPIEAYSDTPQRAIAYAALMTLDEKE